MDDCTAYLEPTLALARKTSDAILDIYQKSRQFEVQAKQDASPLTQADILAHEILVAGLKQLTPDIPIISEEGGNIPFAVRQQWPRYWLLDPIDGTKEFIKHTGEFAISIALIEQHQPVMGIIYVPVTDTLFYAIVGQGAFKQEINQPARRLQKVITANHKTRIALGHHYKLIKLNDIFSKLDEIEIIRIGSCVLKFCLLAEGKIDLYPRLGPTAEWDTAAGQIILSEVGGATVNLTGEPLTYNKKDSLLNPSFIAVGDPQILKKIL